MSETQYAATVTQIISEIAGPDFEFPASAEADIHACFLRRTDPAVAAEKLLADWASEQRAYRYAVANQGFAGNYSDWTAQGDEERAAYEQGAAGNPTA